ncbi:16S rRNA (guanine(966)-N(2))-methyltransferase RsmD [Elioraea sp.]|uniref:16S rRNA (guanine(966)-N(2))-methyltransferase RsmD n=1 Tax=Elioraea sp. TaxID=2185103 RepID=UPI0021DDF649|nr:16S rRNA (guanine(966)-N(2))-methyltransferase RsmD [Elioraea sp.]GIX09283.1 MAG: DNA methyltransferase [Elioraea sp.]
MRVIAGAWRGKRLVAPAGERTRPTADRARQMVFDVLWHARWAGRGAIEGTRVLDAFAGSGAMGIEALSRGAAEAIFLETDTAALAAIRTNLRACRAEARGRVLRADATAPPPAPAPCGLVFLDPPYGGGLVPRALAALAAAGWVAPAALIVAETEIDAPTPEIPGFLPVDRRAVGRAAMTILRRAGGT